MRRADPVHGEIDAIEKLLAQLGERVASLKARINAAPTMGQQAKALLDWYVVEWAKTYPGQQYVVLGAKEIAAFKDLLKTLTAHEIAVRARSYLRDRHGLAAESKHPIAVFKATINRYHNAQATATASNDAAATTREMLRHLRGDHGQ